MAISSAPVSSPDFPYIESTDYQSVEGPREVAIVRKSAVPLLLGPTSECRKSTWYMQVDSDSSKCSIHMTRDFDDHKRRRKAWDRGFAIKGQSLFYPKSSCNSVSLSAEI